jgi:cobalt/nickel transport system permease protein
MGIAVTIGIFLAPFASEHPDGLEAVMVKLGIPQRDASAIFPVPMPDYQFALFGPTALGAATAAAGVLGTIVVFAFATLFTAAASRATPRRPARAQPLASRRGSPDAA